MSPQSKHDSNNGEAQNGLDPAQLGKELTCISEEGIADMDFQVIKQITPISIYKKAQSSVKKKERLV